MSSSAPPLEDDTITPALAAPSAEIALAVDGLCKAFGSETVLDHVSFRVRRGEFLALLGSSGAGKTTLIRCLAGLAAPDYGAITLHGADIRSLVRRERRRIAVIFQQFNLVGRRSALDNVLAGRFGYVPPWRGLTRFFSRSDRLLALECLDRVGLLAQAWQRADTLSGGQQQRVAIARVLAQQPDVVLADEPIASLDPQLSSEILELLRDICRAEGMAVVCSLHQLHFARRYADRIAGLVGGRIVIDIPAHDFGRLAAERVYRTDVSATGE